jgi:hypothetical protein
VADGTSTMPDNPPLAAAGPRDPEERPRPIPKAVRLAVALMVAGKRDDPDCAPLSFIEAAKLAGIKPDVMRRYLDRTNVRALLRSERRTFREAICAGNEGALRRVRDKSANGMVVVASVRALEQLGDVDAGYLRNPNPPAVQINIVTNAIAVAPEPTSPSPARLLPSFEPPTVDVKPGPQRDAAGYLVDEAGNRMFDPRPR